MVIRNVIAASVLALLAGAAGSASAAGDAAAGKTKSLTCLGCHGVKGYFNVYPSYHVPRLGGQHAEYIVAALKAYKNGERDHRTMHVQAISLSEQDMEDIGAYLASMSRE